MLLVRSSLASKLEILQNDRSKLKRLVAIMIKIIVENQNRLHAIGILFHGLVGMKRSPHL